ncbi:hypothetical protein LEMLEM_LOCUS23062 [Lemmus lemmus]
MPALVLRWVGPAEPRVRAGAGGGFGPLGVTWGVRAKDWNCAAFAAAMRKRRAWI